jgi:hypothetical protein
MEKETQDYIDKTFEQAKEHFQLLFSNIVKSIEDVKNDVSELLRMRMLDHDKLIKLESTVNNNTKDINNVAQKSREQQKKISNNMTRLTTIETTAKTAKLFFIMVIIQLGGLIISGIGLIIVFIKLFK